MWVREEKGREEERGVVQREGGRVGRREREKEGDGQAGSYEGEDRRDGRSNDGQRRRQKGGERERPRERGLITRVCWPATPPPGPPPHRYDGGRPRPVRVRTGTPTTASAPMLLVPRGVCAGSSFGTRRSRYVREGSVERMEGGRKKEVGWKETMERGAEGLKEKRAEGTANLKGV